MDVNGCHIVSEPNDNSPDGFLSTVAKDGVSKGPFATIKEAIQCASTWTASTSEAVQVTDPAVTANPDPATTAPSEPAA